MKYYLVVWLRICNLWYKEPFESKLIDKPRLDGEYHNEFSIELDNEFRRELDRMILLLF